MRASGLLFLAFGVLAWTEAGAAAPDDSTMVSDVQRWEQLFRARMVVLERRYDYQFDPDWEPKVTFGIPPTAPPSMQAGFNVWYMAATGGFLVGPPYRDVLPNLAEFTEDVIAHGIFAKNRNQVREIIDHELGHRITDEIGQRLGICGVPTAEEMLAIPFEERIGRRVILEGIACYYEATSVMSDVPLRTEKGQYLFPTSDRDMIWQHIDFAYEGGAWLVHPILERYGEDGIIYLLTHPLTYRNGDVYSAALAYQRAALEDLAR